MPLSPLPLRRIRRPWRLFFILTGVVLVVIVGGAAFAGWTISRVADAQLVKIPSAFPAPSLRPTVAPSVTAQNGGTPQNILLLGSDTRGSIGDTINNLKGQRSDTIMVVHVSADRSEVNVMSIMRDSWVPIPGHGEAKINAALSWGGVPLAVQTVESLLGTRIDHVAVVDFAGFQTLTNAVGGITVDNPIAFDPIHLKGQHFTKGPVHLTGVQALAFVRERYAFADGDFQRVRNQQLVITAIANKIMSADTLTSLPKLSALFTAVTSYVAVDEGLTAEYLAGLGLELRDTQSVRFFTMPTQGTGTSSDGQSIVNVDWATLSTVQHDFQNDTLQDFQPERQTMQ
ncbi:LCP family protein [Glaciibacter psychrotolerans]|uniref:LCP family protein required for cell wall assembly n=1 Tax=Glaciibacter psychrotolerans TaxID=670054 RepID=A0A7Z0EEL4_9MICO|nr:LCP family protein [Leifsonia psychrotolerans]NYJ20232.1 LCP family protein required for cell wall assembly [Leifsonia psychrotolerans]